MSDEKISLKELGLEILQVPDELKENMMWAGSTYKLLDAKTGRRDKAPRNIHTGERISVTSSEGWVTFNEVMNSGYPAFGFRLTKDDPYTVIDLDDTLNLDDRAYANKIYRSFESYTEWSKSGKGIHIILKGTPQAGRRRRNVEVYSQERYIICTGDVFQGREDFKVMEGGNTLENLIQSLSPTDNPDSLGVLVNHDMTHNDEIILRNMFAAQNGESIENLYISKPASTDDWSKLDSQLAQHICFYTKNHEQALRLFRGSALYRGDGSKSGYERVEKYEEDYLLRRTFARAWSLEKKREDERAAASAEIAEQFSLKNKIVEIPVETPVVDIGTLSLDTFDEWLDSGSMPPMTQPSGLLGEMSAYIYKSAPRPVHEIAIAGALAMLSGIAGRHYNINKSGLGLYIVLLADTGRGKEAANSGVSNLLEAVSNRIPAAAMFRGPSQIASGQGLTRMMSDNESIPSKFSILSEFGHTMKIITDRDANAADQRTRQVMLDLWSKTGWGQVIQETAYADKTRDTAVIKSPNLTILGDTTPEKFFESIRIEHVKDGFIPRFMLIEYEGDRKAANYNINASVPDDVVVRLTTLITQVLAMRDSDNHYDIDYGSDEAFQILNDFDLYADEMVNTKDNEYRELWNRAHLKALRLAGIFAVSDNFFEPRVTVDNATLAVEYVLRDMMSYLIRFRSGAFGAGDGEREAIMSRELHKYFAGEIDFEKFNIAKLYVDNGLVTTQYLYDRLANHNAFNNTTKTSRVEIDGLLMSLIKQGVVQQVDSRELSGIDRKLVTRTEAVFSRGPQFNRGISRYGYEGVSDADEQASVARVAG